MKPKTLDDIFDAIQHCCFSTNKDYKDLYTTRHEAKSQIIELFKGCVPDEQDGWKNSLEDATEVYGFNTCRSQTLKNMEKMR